MWMDSRIYTRQNQQKSILYSLHIPQFSKEVVAEEPVREIQMTNVIIFAIATIWLTITFLTTRTYLRMYPHLNRLDKLVVVFACLTFWPLMWAAEAWQWLNNR